MKFETIVSDSRTEPRRILRCTAIVKLKNSYALKARTLDVSPGGMCLMAPSPIPQNQVCTVSFATPVGIKVEEINVVGTVIYTVCVGTSGFRIGLRFTDVAPASKAAIEQLVR